MKKFLIMMISIFVLLLAGGYIYVNDYYHADMEMIQEYQTNPDIEMIKKEHNYIWDVKEASRGVIFYPGGKVDTKAYIPLMEELASKGITCILIEMPLRLAVFDQDAAKGIAQEYPHIQEWYLAGHSLGGSMAASYLSDCEESYQGLILLGSYSTADISDIDLNVLSIYGSEDHVLNKEKYNESKSNLGDDLQEVIINGGCHAYFGMYGNQAKDGKATITNQQQIQQTAKEIQRFLEEE